MVVARSALKLFLLPGNFVPGTAGATADDGRATIPSLVNMSLVNMLVWSPVAVVALW